MLLCQHSEEGAFGLVMNRPVTTTAKVMAHGTIDEPAEHELEVWIGGPVEPDRSWILLPDDDSDDEAIRVCEGVFLSTSATRAAADHRPRRRRPHAPDRRLRGLGPRPARCGARRLRVAQRGCHPDLIFDTPAEDMWERAIRRLGATPGGLQTGQGVH